jgi:hypothetical protein
MELSNFKLIAAWLIRLTADARRQREFVRFPVRVLVG